MSTTAATLDIAEGLHLPLSFVTGTQAILGIKGSGKSHTASVEAEELLEAGQQIVVIDPTGAWWGLRSSRDGDSAGYPVVVMGGHHGDLALPHSSGRAVAGAVFGTRTSVVLDLSVMNKTEQAVFIGALLEELYRLMDASKVLHVFADEAHMYAPQGARGEKTRSAGAMEAVVSRGRIKGIGVTMITQRPQKLNKDVLTQADTLCCHRLSHPRDIDAVGEWVGVHVSIADSPKRGPTPTSRYQAMLNSLPSLPTGEAWVWSPLADLFQRVHIRQRRTFDSGRTPEPGVAAVVPKKIADVDVDSLRAAIEGEGQAAGKTDGLFDAIAHGDDEHRAWLKQAIKDYYAGRKVQRPAGNATHESLRQKIRSLETQLDETQKLLRETAPSDEMRGQLYMALNEVGALLAPLNDLRGMVETVHNRLRFLHAKATATAPREDAKSAPTPRKNRKASRKVEGAELQTVQVKSLTTRDSKLGKCERAILAALGAHPKGLSRLQIAVIARYSHKSGGFRNALGALRSAGLIEYTNGGARITTAGLKLAPEGELAPRRGKALREYWKEKLGKCERAILDALASRNEFFNPLEVVAAEAGYSARSGGFRNAVGRLRSLGLVNNLVSGVIGLAKELR